MKILASLLFLISSLAFAQPDPVHCTGYPESRVFLQSQAYWDRTPGKNGTDFGSVSEGTCFPVGATLTGKVDFDVLVTLYDNPGKLTTVELQLFGKQSGKIIASAAKGDYKPCNTNPCPILFHLVGNTALYPLDGLQEFRFHARVTEPDGKQLMATTGWQAILKNGHSVSNYRPQGVNFQEARGWYTNEGYTTGRFTSPIPWQPVSGVYKFNVAAVKGSGGRSVGSHLVSLDACAICEPEIPGTVLNSGSGELNTTLSLDTTKLGNGVHTVSVKASAPSPTGSTLSGTEVIPIVVSN